MPQKRKITTSRKNTARKAAETRKKQEAAEKARRQTTAVLLFAGAILLFCLVIIPGGSLWGFLHNVMMGFFGIAAYIFPFLIGYVAVVYAMEQSVDFRVKPWQCVMAFATIVTVIHLFVSDAQEVTYWEAIRDAFTVGTQVQGGGVAGALLGHPMEFLFTDVGAKIIVILLIFVSVMLLTGTSVISLVKTLWKPVQKTKETLETAVETVTENAVARRQKSSFDVELGSGYPDTQVQQESVIVVEDEEAKKADSLRAFEQAAAQMQEETPPAAKTADSAPTSEEPIEEFVVETEEKAKEIPEEYVYPPLSLLNESKSGDLSAAQREQNSTADLLVQTLQEFGVSAKVINISRGPTVTRYELQPSAGVKISRITGLADDIALRLATTGVRIEAPIPNKAAVGIEVPNRVSGSVCLRDLIGSKEFKNAPSRLTVALGKDIAGQIVLADLAKMPHLLIAGTTGSGKSVCTNSMIQSVLFHARPDEVKLLLVDPKQVEFGIYNGIPHLLVPVVTDPRKAAGALGWSVNEMLRRYKLFAENNVRDLTTYNEVAKQDERLEVLPQILIIIDELADLMMVAANEVQSNICRLAQMARAAGMHLVIATQRPSVDVITGLIKANIPSRLALTVASAVDSRTILDTGGAEKLLGKGDMLFMPVGFAKPMRVQGCFVGNREVESVVDFLKSTESQQYDEAVINEIERQAQATEKSSKGDDGVSDAGDGDEMLPQAIEVVVEAGMASTSLLQRRLRLGYARAGRIIDEMEQRGIVGPHEGSKPRQVLITRQQWLEMNMIRPDDGE